MSEKSYHNLSIDPIDINGISKEEIEFLTFSREAKASKWRIIETQNDNEKVMVRYKNKEGFYYTQDAYLPVGTSILINESIEIAILPMCRNNIESDWRTLVKLMK